MLKEKKKRVNNVHYSNGTTVQQINFFYYNTYANILPSFNSSTQIFQHKQEAEAKKEDAVASYEAWKEKKAEALKAKAKEKQDKIRKEQRVNEEKEEKRQSAQQVY